MNSIIALFLMAIVFFFSYKGWEKEALLILVGTSYIIYPIIGELLILDVYFLLIVFKNIRSLQIKTQDLVYLLILLAVAFMPSFLYIGIDAIFQPLRLIEIVKV